MLSIGRYLFYQVTVVCSPISANNDIMYAFLYLSDFLRRFSTHRTCSMYLLLTNFAIIDLGRVCGRVVIIWSRWFTNTINSVKTNFLIADLKFVFDYVVNISQQFSHCFSGIFMNLKFSFFVYFCKAIGFFKCLLATVAVSRFGHFWLELCWINYKLVCLSSISW